jgi:hypothetical protein
VDWFRPADRVGGRRRAARAAGGGDPGLAGAVLTGRGYLAAGLLLLGVGAVADGADGPWWLVVVGGLCLLFVPALIVDEARMRRRSEPG